MASNQDLNDLFSDAGRSGVLSPSSVRALTIVDQNDEIQQCLGVDVDFIPFSELLLVPMLLDDSSSIAARGNQDAVVRGHNLILDSLTASNQQDNIFAHLRMLNRGVIHPFRQLSDVPRLGPDNYQPSGFTPLYDQTFLLLKTALAESERVARQGIVARTVILIVTDGRDEGSRIYTPAQIRGVVEDMLRMETHLVIAMGISDGFTDFRRVFQEMGIPGHLILTPGDSEAEIRNAFQVASWSAVQASRSAGGFSRVALGGFGV